MAKNSTKFIKRGAIATLKGNAPLIALVPAARIYPMQRPPEPVWPWVGWGATIGVPFVASCLDGSDITVAIHSFAETTGSGAQTIPGEDAAADLNAAVEAALDGATIDLTEFGCPYPATAHFTSAGNQVVQDGAGPDKFHGFVSFRIIVSS